MEGGWLATGRDRDKKSPLFSHDALIAANLSSSTIALLLFISVWSYVKPCLQDISDPNQGPLDYGG